MRELVKSMTSFSWAMVVFGFQGTLSLLPAKESGRQVDDAARALDHVTQATRNHLSGFTETAFRAGDRLQKEFLNVMFDVWAPELRGFSGTETDGRRDSPGVQESVGHDTTTRFGGRCCGNRSKTNSVRVEDVDYA